MNDDNKWGLIYLIMAGFVIKSARIVDDDFYNSHLKPYILTGDSLPPKTAILASTNQNLTASIKA